MSAFKKPLPLKIFSNENQNREIFLKCYFESMEPSYMKVFVDKEKVPFDLGTDLSIEFIVSSYRFQFDSALLSEVQNGYILIRKPKVIYKKSL